MVVWRSPRFWLATITLGLAAMGIALRFTADNATSAVYVLIPTALALTVVLARPAKTTTGIMMRWLTFAMLVPVVLVWESIICMVFIAPLFYAIGLLIVWISNATSDRPSRLSVVAVPLLLLSLEGVLPITTAERTNAVVHTTDVDAPAEDVWHRLAHRRGLLPAAGGWVGLLARPTSTAGEGLAPRDRRVVEFDDGVLVLEVAEAGAGHVSYHVVSDTTPVSDLMEWMEVTVTVEDLGDRSRVTWTVEYERQLDPAWYFGPMQQLAVAEAVEYLAREFTTP